MRKLAVALGSAALAVGLGTSHLLPSVAETAYRADTLAVPMATVATAARVPAITAHAHEVLRGAQVAKLGDGSTVELKAPAGQLTVDNNEPDHVSMHLDLGSAHFEVVPNTQRRFSVFVDAVEIVVVGTAFDVERATDRVRVEVKHGKVLVRAAGETRFVEGGQVRWFEQSAALPKLATRAVAQAASAGPTETVVSPIETRPPAAASVLRAARRQAKSARAAQLAAAAEPARAEWRSLNQSGDPEGAYRLIENGALVANDPESLMDAADAARLTNHPEMAVVYLRRVVTDHRENAATPLAAFTLGRVLLERLGRPADAAQAFATARELSPQGSLATDALAREVESWSKAGHEKEAYERSRLFTRLYPTSRRLDVVKRYGGI